MGLCQKRCKIECGVSTFAAVIQTQTFPCFLLMFISFLIIDNSILLLCYQHQIVKSDGLLQSVICQSAKVVYISINIENTV